MAIPKFSEFLSPVLGILNTIDYVKAKELRDKLSIKLNITLEDREILLPSGRQRMFDNRVNWAITYLKKAGLVESPSRGEYRITDQGKSAFREYGELIDIKFLDRYEAFRDFHTMSSDDTVIDILPPQKPDITPQDSMDIAFRQINEKLADDLLLSIKDKPPVFFERLVVNLLLKMGYGGAFDEAGLVTRQSGDEGIDGVIREDKLGFSNIYIQAKSWDSATKVGRPEIQKFVGALAGQGAQKGLFITTAQFSKDALTYAQKQSATKVVLVDGITLTKLMIDYDIGVSTVSTYLVKRIDLDFFNEEYA